MKTIVGLLLFCNYIFAYCIPCFCVESTSGPMSDKYLEVQIDSLTKKIVPDIQKALQKAKEAYNDSKKSYIITLQTEKLLLSGIEDEQRMIQQLSKIAAKKKLEILLKINEIKSKMLHNELSIKKEVNNK